MNKISIIAPAHNEEEAIGEFIKKVKIALTKNRLAGELIIVDDGSTDATLSHVEEYKKQESFITLLHSPRREGITASYKKGLAYASGDFVLFLPTDLESDPVEDIPKLLEPFSSGYDAVSGWRQGKENEKIKIVSSRLFNSFARFLFQSFFHDLGWIKAFKRDVLLDVEPLRSDWHRFIMIFVAEKGYKVKEVKVNYYPRRLGISKFGVTGFGRIFGALIDLVVVKFLISFAKKPMFVFGTMGVMFFGFGFIGGLYLIYIKLVVGSIGSRIPFLFLVLLLLTSGIQLFVFGFLGEMIASMRDRLK